MQESNRHYRIGRSAERSLAEQLQLERRISSASSRLLGAETDWVDAAIRESLVEVAAAIEVDGAWLIEVTADAGSPCLRHEWYRPGLELPTERASTKPSAVGELPWLRARAESLDAVSLARLDDLPPQAELERAHLDELGVRSLLSLPLVVPGQRYGMVGFESRSCEICWGEDLIEQLSRFAEILSKALARRDAALALRESEGRFRAFFENSPDAMSIKDLDRRYLLVNAEFENMSGRRREDVLGKPFDVQAWGGSARVHAAIWAHEQEVLDTEEPSRQIRDYVDRDGRRSVMLVARFPIRDARGRIVGVGACNHDITERVLAEEALTERLAFEEMISRISADFVNMPASEIDRGIHTMLTRVGEFLGADRSYIMEYDESIAAFWFGTEWCRDGVTPLMEELEEVAHDAEVSPAWFKALTAGRPWRMNAVAEVEARGEGDTEYYAGVAVEAELGLPVMLEGRCIATIGMEMAHGPRRWRPQEVDQMKLVSEIAANALWRKRTEFELVRHRHNLEELVEERARDLESAQQALIRSERLATLGRLTATVSHELRNPLGTIRSSATALQVLATDVNDDMRLTMERIDRNIDRCVNIIEHLLSYTKIRALELAPVRIDDWLVETLGELDGGETRSLRQSLRSGGTVAVDVERLRQVLINLLSNANHAISEAGRTSDAEIVVATEQLNGRVQLSISDNGVGIEPDSMSRIFEPLFSTKNFGVGLGLPLVKEVIEAHGGSVEVASEPGRGTAVTLCLNECTETETSRSAG